MLEKPARPYLGSWPRPSDTTIAVVLFVGALIVRLAWCAVSMKVRGRPPVDPFDPWDTLAQSILRGEGLRWEFLELVSYSHRPPVFPLLLTPIRYFFGDGAWPVYVMNSLFGAANTVLLWSLGRRLFGQTAGLIAGAAFLLWPFSVAWAAGPQPEVFCTLLLTLALWALLTGRPLLTGVLLGVLGLTRSNYIFLTPLIAIWLIYAGRRRELLPLLVAWALALTPWVARNYVVHGAFMLTSSDGGMAFVIGNDKEMIRRQLAGESERYDPRNYLFGEILPELKTMPEPKQNSLMYRAALGHIKQIPGDYARVVVKRFGQLWNPVPDSAGAAGRALGIPLVLAHLAALWGVIACWRDRRRRAVVVLLVGLLAFASGFILVRGISRYKAPVEPVIVLLCGCGVADLLARLGRRTGRRVPAAPVEEISS